VTDNTQANAARVGPQRMGLTRMSGSQVKARECFATGGAQPRCKPIEVRAAPTTILKCVPNERLSIDTAGLDERCLTSPALGWSAYA